ncbi:aspartyl protease family protein 2 [Mangifera indica]|uniref:aspartyl protease family protein 2 n=1 Tax=Mangifera indica TaxID=29780 RepID=UPI001CFC241F|nr:aspartyl protease family protein 2 [Mangifera indica]
MEGNAEKILLFSFFTIFFSSTVTSTSNYLQSQILVLSYLPNPSTFSWTQSDSQTNINELTDSNGESSIFLDLHHVDNLVSITQNLDSLSLNETQTSESLFNLRLQRDSLRVKTLNSIIESAALNGSGARRSGAFSSSIISGLAQGSGEYFTRIGVGTPPKYVYMVLDTGSDVLWLQCAPCRKCYSQTDPIFEPLKSRSYSKLPCGSPICRRLESSGCSTKTHTCLYQVSYGDGSFTVGEFSTETLTFRGSKVGKVALGCGHDNEGLFVGAGGLMGLGRGTLSFPAQTGRQFNGKFSYCLVDRSTSSKPSSMVFGNAAVSRTARFTPLVTNPMLDTFYYVELLGISVGGARVPGIVPSLFKLDETGNGGVIIDSGTSVTRLTQPAYIRLRDAFRVGASGLKRGADFSLFDTCFDLSGMKEVKVPTVVLHFRGADMSLPATNYLIPVDSSGTFCFAFAGTMNKLSIIGNIQQQGFRVVYDLADSRVGFAPRGCA